MGGVRGGWAGGVWVGGGWKDSNMHDMIIYRGNDKKA